MGGDAVSEDQDPEVLRPSFGRPSGSSRDGDPPNGGVGERLARLETELRHVATKADVESIKTELVKAIGASQSSTLKWQIGIVVAAAMILGTAALISK